MSARTNVDDSLVMGFAAEGATVWASRAVSPEVEHLVDSVSDDPTVLLQAATTVIRARTANPEHGPRNTLAIVFSDAAISRLSVPTINELARTGRPVGVMVAGG